jgi:septal ring factor EnvC (AmiA/AmiB activator)
MILRRASRSDPRFVLGSALAFVLPLGANLAAFAQDSSAQAPATQVPSPQVPWPQVPSPSVVPAPGAPAKPDLDVLKQHDQELDATRAQQRAALEAQTKLKLEIEAIGADRRALNQQLIDTAARVRDVEANIEATQARLKPLDERERIFKTSLDERRTVIVEILAALQRIGRQPPPALMVRPEDALQAVRTAIMLGAVVPEMRTQADALAGDLAELLRVRKDIDGENAKLSRDLATLAHEQLRLNMLIDERQQKQTAVEQTLDAQRQRATDLAHQVDNLKDLIGKLEQGLDPPQLPRHRGRRHAPRPGRFEGSRPAHARRCIRGESRAFAFAGQWIADSRVRRLGRRRWNSKGTIHRNPFWRRDNCPVRRLGCLRRTVSQLWPTLDPQCRRRVSCAVSGDGADFRRSRPVRADR